jgi:hypothetical protein
VHLISIYIYFSTEQRFGKLPVEKQLSEKQVSPAEMEAVWIFDE